MEHERATCSGCHRTPLVGEYLHRLATGSFLCGLCLRRLPEAERAAESSERMHAGERSLRVSRAESGPGRRARESSARAA